MTDRKRKTNRPFGVSKKQIRKLRTGARIAARAVRGSGEVGITIKTPPFKLTPEQRAAAEAYLVATVESAFKKARASR